MFLHTETDATLVVDGQPLGYDVSRAESIVAQTVGVIGRRGVPEGAALVFPFDSVRRRTIHMLGVRAPIQTWWVRDGVLEQADRLTAWTGIGRAEADCVIELPADAPTPEPGSAVALEFSDPDGSTENKEG